MRSPGENAVGQTPGRRHRSSGRNVPPRAAAPRQPGSGEASPLVPGYQVSQETAAQPADESSDYGFRGFAGSGKGPVRGDPPAPGQPPRRSADDLGEAGGTLGFGPAGSAYLPGDAAAYLAADDPADSYEPGYDNSYEPGYSVLAVSDPAADATSTQTWGTVGAAAG